MPASGTKEINNNSDAWMDCYDSDGILVDGAIEEFPEGWVWTCCGKSGDAEYCRDGKHVPRS